MINQYRILLIIFNFKSQMIYSSTKDSMMKALVGIEVQVQGTDAGEMEEAALLEKVKALSK